MKPAATVFTCTHCDAQFSKWAGRCLQCGQWSTIVESRITNNESRMPVTAGQPINIHALHDIALPEISRLQSSIGELDRVLGGGFVPGSLVLLAGEPGIGKSTLSLHIAAHCPGTLYVSGEESLHQVKLRAERLHLGSATIAFAHAADADDIAATIILAHPPLAIVDSIHTIRSSEAEGAPGSVSQVRAACATLMTAAKDTGTAILLIGHITKDGMVAGPKTLEHLVDAVLIFEGSAEGELRMIRAAKNRFGSTDEIARFTMKEKGLVEVADPSAMLLGARGEPIPGSVLACLMEGTRPALLEIQALVTKTAFGYPVRKASGCGLNRLHLLVAVLEKWAGLNFAAYDIHVNVVGGADAREPAVDLALCLALASAYKERVLGADLVAFGEVGLGGEVKRVSQEDRRVRACATLGLSRVILPKSKTPRDAGGIRLIEVSHLRELLTAA